MSCTFWNLRRRKHNLAKQAENIRADVENPVENVETAENVENPVESVEKPKPRKKRGEAK